MALDIPMPESPGSSLLQGLNTGSDLIHKMMLNKYNSTIHPSGDVANAMYVESLRNKFGENDPRYIATKNAMDVVQQGRQSLMDYRNNLLHGPARDALDLEKLRGKVGEDSPAYQDAKATYDSNINAKKDLSDLRARTKQGLKSGEKEFFDDTTGKALGKEIPLTEKERESEQGNILFNELYPIVYKGASPFSGEGSITRLQNAAANYKTDPKARQIFDDYLLADKMLAATTVNEASTLKAGRTNRTYAMLKDSLASQDIPNVVKNLIKQYNIPQDAQLRAAMRYQKSLSDAREKAKRNTPATQKLFYDPEHQAQHEQQQNNDAGGGEPSSSITSVIVIDPNGKRYKTTKANAAHLPQGWSHG